MTQVTVFSNRSNILFNFLVSFRTYPIRGFQIYDGPIRLTKSTFKNFVPTPDRFTSAIGFLMKNPWQLTPRNNVSFLKFGANVSKLLCVCI